MKSGSQSGGGGGESSHPRTSLREFARQIGVSDTAVRKAIAAGRLSKSLGKAANGGVFIADVEVGRAEWDASSRTSTGVRTKPAATANQPAAGSQVPAAPPPAPPAASSAAREELDADEPDEEVGGQLVFAKTLIDAQTLATNERARKLKFENDVTEGRLIPIERVTKEAFEAERIIRENMLNLVARVGGELHAERDLKRFLIKFEHYVHQGLNQTADALMAVNE